MPAHPKSAIHLVRAAARAAGLGERPDSELLTAFLAGDPAAFEAIVRRHGPMVLRTCRTATRCEADADDAFQATFVLLHRKAAGVRDRRSIAGGCSGWPGGPQRMPDGRPTGGPAARRPFDGQSCSPAWT